MEKFLVVPLLLAVLATTASAQISENFKASGSSISGDASISITESKFHNENSSFVFSMLIMYDYYMLNNLSFNLIPSFSIGGPDFDLSRSSLSFATGIGINYYLVPENVDDTKLVYSVGAQVSTGIAESILYDYENNNTISSYVLSLGLSTRVGLMYFLTQNTAISSTMILYLNNIIDKPSVSFFTFIGYSYFIPRKYKINIK